MARTERDPYVEDEFCLRKACEAERTVSNIANGFN